MTIVECYQQLGGNLENVKTRLPSDSLIKRFIIKFLDDSSYSELCDALQKGQRDEAFRAAHTLKGVLFQHFKIHTSISPEGISSFLRSGYRQDRQKKYRGKRIQDLPDSTPNFC